MQHTNVSVVKVNYVNIPASAIRHSDEPRSDLQLREHAKYCPTERESRQQTKQKQNNNNMIVSL